MPCIPTIPITCVGSAGNAIGGAATSVLGNSFADAMRDGAVWVIRTTIGWWIEVQPIDLSTSPAPTIRGYVLWLAMVVATAGIIWKGILMALTRRSTHLLDVGRGLFVFALWAAIGIAGPAAALKAGDVFARWILDEASSGQAADRLIKLAGLQAISSPGAVIVIGLVLMLAGLVQAVLMMFREGALVVLSGVVVLAAAGQFTRATRPWLPKITGWMLALICFKPAAAMVYATALVLVGEGQDPRTVLVGLSMLVMAVFTLPTLMKFFTWAAGTASHGGEGGLAAMVGASAAAIHATASLSSSTRPSASDQANRVRQDLGGGHGGSAIPSGASAGGAAARGATAGAQTAGTAAGAGAGAAAAAGPIGMAAVAGTQLAGSMAKSGSDAAKGAMTGESK